jgi:hypothetical protein
MRRSALACCLAVVLVGHTAEALGSQGAADAGEVAHLGEDDGGEGHVAAKLQALGNVVKRTPAKQVAAALESGFTPSLWHSWDREAETQKLDASASVAVLNSYLCANVEDGSKVMRVISWVKNTLKTRRGHTDTHRAKLQKAVAALQVRVDDTKELAQQTNSPAAQRLAKRTQSDLGEAMRKLRAYDAKLDMGDAAPDKEEGEKKAPPKVPDELPKAKLERLTREHKFTKRQLLKAQMRYRAAMAEISVLDEKLKNPKPKDVPQLQTDNAIAQKQLKKLERIKHKAERKNAAAKLALDEFTETYIKKVDPEVLKKSAALVQKQNEVLNAAKKEQAKLVKALVESDHKVKLAKATLQHAKHSGEPNVMKSASKLLTAAEAQNMQAKKEVAKSAQDMEDAAHKLQKIAKAHAGHMTTKFKNQIAAAAKRRKRCAKKLSCFAKLRN